MTHYFMAAVANGLYARRIASLRYQFPSMQRGSKRPDQPAVAHAAVRAAVAEARRRCPALPLVAGGKSFGGRMTSQAQAAQPLPGVIGIGFIGFPLHPAGKPSDQRATHLGAVECPMLFLQGTRDTLAETDLLRQLVVRLGSKATLSLITDADHSFHVPKRSGRTDAQVLETNPVSDAIASQSSHAPARKILSSRLFCSPGGIALALDVRAVFCRCLWPVFVAQALQSPVSRSSSDRLFRGTSHLRDWLCKSRTLAVVVLRLLQRFGRGCLGAFRINRCNATE